MDREFNLNRSNKSEALENLPPPPARPRRWTRIEAWAEVAADLGVESLVRFAAWRAAAVHAAIFFFPS